MRDAETRPSGRPRALASFLKSSLPWMWPHALAMGLCQSVMLVPFLLGPLGLGMGGRLWDQPWYTAVFFAALAATMLANEFAGRAGTGRAGAKLGRAKARAGRAGYSLPVCLTFTAGSLALAAHALLDGAASVAMGCVGAALMGFGSARAQLSSARFLATLSSSACTVLVMLSTAASSCALVVAAVGGGAWAGFLFSAFPAVAYALKRAHESGPVPDQALASSDIDVLGSVGADGTVRAGAVAGCAVATGALVVFAARCGLGSVGAGPAGLGALPSTLFAFALCALVLAVMALACLKTKTLSMTFIYRLSLPLVIAGAVAVALAPQAAGASGAPYWLAAFGACAALLFIDQMVWVTTASFMRFDPGSNETTASRFRLLQYTGATLGAVAAAPSVLTFGVMPTMLACVALLGTTFIVCIPTYEARIVSAGARAPRMGDIGEEARARHGRDFARYGLTAREAETVCLMLEGLDAPGIARRLVVSRATVNTHIRHVYEKCGVHSREELAALLGEMPRRAIPATYPDGK